MSDIEFKILKLLQDGERRKRGEIENIGFSYGGSDIENAINRLISEDMICSERNDRGITEYYRIIEPGSQKSINYTIIEYLDNRRESIVGLQNEFCSFRGLFSKEAIANAVMELADRGLLILSNTEEYNFVDVYYAAISIDTLTA